MSNYGLIMMALGVCGSSNTAAVHTGDAGLSCGFESHLKQLFWFNNF